MAEPVRDEAEDRAEHEGEGVRVRGGDVREQERAAAQVEPGLQEDTGSPPWGQAHMRVDDHRAVRGRRLGWAHHPPLRPLRPRRRPLLGRLHRRQVVPFVGWDREGAERGGESRSGVAGVRGAAAVGGGLREMQQGEGLLRRGGHRIPRHRPGLLLGVAQGEREDGRRGHQVPGRGQDAPPGRMGGPLLLPPRRQGCHAGDRQAGRLRQGPSGQVCSCSCSCSCCKIIARPGRSIDRVCFFLVTNNVELLYVCEMRNSSSLLLLLFSFVLFFLFPSFFNHRLCMHACCFS